MYLIAEQLPRLLWVVMLVVTIAGQTFVTSLPPVAEANTSISRKAGDSINAMFVLNTNGTPCLLASFSASIHIIHETFQPDTNRSTNKMTQLHVPKDSLVSGKCGSLDTDNSLMTLTWKDNQFELSLFFEKVVNQQMEWMLHQLKLAFDVDRPQPFPEAEPERVELESNVTQVGAPQDQSLVCHTGYTIWMRAAHYSASVVFTDVHLQPFNSTFGQDHQCKDDMEAEQVKKAKTVYISLIVAACLAAIVVIVIIVFAVSRNFSKTHYKTMD